MKLVACKACGLTRDCQELSYEHEYTEQAGTYQPPSERQFEQDFERMRRYVRFVTHVSRVRGRMLDVGCNAGQLMCAFQEAQWSASGLDLNPTVVKYARSKGLDAACRTLSQSKFNEETFDLVALSHTLEHIPALDELMGNVRRILKPEGLLFVAVPNFGCRTELTLRQGRWSGFAPGQHIWYFTRGTLADTLRRLGFAQVQLRSAVDHPTGGRSLPSRLFRSLVGAWERLLDDGNELVGVFRKTTAPDF